MATSDTHKMSYQLLASIFVQKQRTYEHLRHLEHLKQQDEFIRSTLLTDAQRTRLAEWQDAHPAPSPSQLAEQYRQSMLLRLTHEHNRDAGPSEWTPQQLEQLPLVKAMQAKERRRH